MFFPLFKVLFTICKYMGPGEKVHRQSAVYRPLALLNIVHMSMTVTGADQFLRTTSIVSILMDP